MLAVEFIASVQATRSLSALDETARLLWKAHGDGALDDAAAESVSEALAARRAALRAPKPIVVAIPRRPKHARSPDRQASLERRRRQAMSGAVPSAIAAHFTMGELAALTVIGRACQRSGVCTLPIDMIAALAGVSRSTVQNAMREAKRRALIDVRERRRRGRASLTNVVSVISKEWSGWLKLAGGGFKKFDTTYSHTFRNRRILDKKAGVCYDSGGYAREADKRQART